jgi:hypothetical protein
MAAYESVMAYGEYTPQVVEAQEASGSANDWYENDLVKLNGSGLTVIATAGIIGGIARKRATGTANTKYELELLDPNAIYVIRAEASTATALVNVGEAFDINYTAGAHYVDTTATSNKEVYIVGIHPGDAVGTSGGRYLVRFSTTKTFDDQAA